MHDLDSIISAHGEAVWRTAYRLLNHHDDALDCYQDTFLAALELARSKPVAHWRSLLVRIATCRAIDRLRRRYQGEQVLEAAADRTNSAPVIASAESRVQAAELRAQVRQALTRLPPNQAEAFWLRHLEQLSVDQIAHEMQIDAGHVRVLVHRAASGLRSLLAATYGPERLQRELP